LSVFLRILTRLLVPWLRAQGYHAFRAEFFANTDSEDMIVKYKGPDTDGSWELVEGVHRTDFDYLNALSLTNLPDPRSPVRPCFVCEQILRAVLLASPPAACPARLHSLVR